MKHCQTTIYHGDKFCADCGEELTEKPKTYNVEDACPGIFDDVRQYYKEAEAKTGRVLEARLYKRVLKEGTIISNNMVHLEYSYWWIKVETTQGEIIETSVSVESGNTIPITCGDIVTLYYPTTMTLNYNATKDARKFVTNDSGVPCIVVHDDKHQRYMVDSIYPEPEIKLPWLWIIVGITTAIYLFTQSSIRTETVWKIALIATVIVFILECIRNWKKYKLASTKYKALFASFDKVLSVTKEQLGYSNIERHKQSSDILCTQCGTRLSHITNYCTCCGNKVASEALPDITSQQITTKESQEVVQLKPEQSQINKDNFTLDETNPSREMIENNVIEAIPTPSSISISDIQQRIHEQYYYQSEDIYTHHWPLASARQGTLSTKLIIARVVSLDRNTKTSEYINSTSTYKGGILSSSSSYHTRTSKVAGKVEIESLSGEIITLIPPEYILGDMNAGDWIAIATSSVDLSKQHDHCYEYLCNMTQGEEYSYGTFANYKQWADIRSKLIWWGSNILFIVGAITGLFIDSPGLTYGCMLGFMPFNLYAFCKAFIASSKNKRQRKALLEPLQERISNFKKSRQDLKKQLDMLG